MMMVGLVEKGDMISVEDGKVCLECLVVDSKLCFYVVYQQLQVGLVNGEVEIVVNYKVCGL